MNLYTIYTSLSVTEGYIDHSNFIREDFVNLSKHVQSTLPYPVLGVESMTT